MRPVPGGDWGDEDRQRDRRQLENRAPCDGRTVLAPPGLTEHRKAHSTASGLDYGIDGPQDAALGRAAG